MGKKINPERLAKIKQAVDYRQPDLTIVFENIFDLHNMSAAMRSAESIGICEIYVLFTHEHLKKQKIKLGKNTSSGARKWLDVHLYNDAQSCFDQVHKKYENIAGAYLGATSKGLYQMDLTKPTAFVFGNEHEGITEETLSFCSQLFTIPQFGMTQSLNLSVAAAVTVYETARQRLEAGYYESNPRWEADQKATLLKEYLDRHATGYKAREVNEIER